MLRSLPLITIFFLLLLSAFNFSPARKQTVGYYNRDSVIHLLPEYKMANDSIAGYCNNLRKNGAKLQLEYFSKYDEFLHADTSSWSPLLMQMKKRELEQMRVMVYEYKSSSLLDSIYMRQRLMRPAETKTDTAAAIVARENKLAAVIDKNSPVAWLNWNSVEVKFRDVTEDVCRQLGILPKEK